MNPYLSRRLKALCLLLGTLLAVLGLLRVSQVQLLQTAQAELDRLRGEHQQLRLHLSRLTLEKQALIHPSVLRQAAAGHLRLAAESDTRIRPLPSVLGTDLLRVREH